MRRTDDRFAQSLGAERSSGDTCCCPTSRQARQRRDAGNLGAAQRGRSGELATMPAASLPIARPNFAASSLGAERISSNDRPPAPTRVARQVGSQGSAQASGLLLERSSQGVCALQPPSAVFRASCSLPEGLTAWAERYADPLVAGVQIPSWIRWQQTGIAERDFPTPRSPTTMTPGSLRRRSARCQSRRGGRSKRAVLGLVGPQPAIRIAFWQRVIARQCDVL